MPQWLEVTRFASVGKAIALALGVEPAPDCRIENGRTTLTFRRLGASRWTESEQMDYVRRIAPIVRTVLAGDQRSKVRDAAMTSLVVVYEDAMILNGCAVTARWECVLPAAR